MKTLETQANTEEVGAAIKQPQPKTDPCNYGEWHRQRGNIMNSLLSKWSDNVGLNIENQIKAFNEEMRNYGSDGSTPYRFKDE